MFSITMMFQENLKHLLHMQQEQNKDAHSNER
jgi:hypothetical protein